MRTNEINYKIMEIAEKQICKKCPHPKDKEKGMCSCCETFLTKRNKIYKEKIENKKLKKKKYRVIEDLQGDEFGFYRNFTIEQWRKQAQEWAKMDNNEEIEEYLYYLRKDKVIPFISEYWQLKFKEIKNAPINKEKLKQEIKKARENIITIIHEIPNILLSQKQINKSMNNILEIFDYMTKNIETIINYYINN